MSLIPWDPFRALRREDLFEQFLREFPRRAELPAEAIAPAVEVAESNGDVTVKMEVPGVDKDKINVTVADDVLTVRGEIRQETEEKKKSFYRREIRYGAFHRAVVLPVEVDAAKASAELKNGMLNITLPKSKQPKAKDVKVAVG